jgi:hypothetical protein
VNILLRPSLVPRVLRLSLVACGLISASIAGAPSPSQAIGPRVFNSSIVPTTLTRGALLTETMTIEFDSALANASELFLTLPGFSWTSPAPIAAYNAAGTCGGVSVGITVTSPSFASATCEAVNLPAVSVPPLGEATYRIVFDRAFAPGTHFTVAVAPGSLTVTASTAPRATITVGVTDPVIPDTDSTQLTPLLQDPTPDPTPTPTPSPSSTPTPTADPSVPSGEVTPPPALPETSGAGPTFLWGGALGGVMLLVTGLAVWSVRGRTRAKVEVPTRGGAAR